MMFAILQADGQIIMDKGRKQQSDAFGEMKTNSVTVTARQRGEYKVITKLSRCNVVKPNSANKIN